MAKQTAKEKYEIQKEKAKERQRRRRAKMTTEELEKKRKYDRDRAEKLKKENKIKRIKDMTEKEKNKMRKYWREQNRKRKAKKQAVEAATANTPPTTPDTTFNEESDQKKRGRKAKRRDRAKAYRTIKKQSEEIKALERRIEKYKKRLNRQKKKQCQKCSPSPRKKVENIVGRENVSPVIKKQLFVGFAMEKQLKSQLEDMGSSKKNRQIFRKTVGDRVIKKYRVQQHFRKLLPYKFKASLDDNTFTYSRNKRVGIAQKHSKEILTFFEDDAVSRMCPGKKDFVRCGKAKKQRRILLDTLYNLHKKFQDRTGIKISLRSFKRTRPFWVTFPKKSDRDTCACVRHSNMELIISSLKQAKVIAERNITDVLSATVCSEKKESCMLELCDVCKNNKIVFHYEEDFKIKLFKWSTVTEDKIIKNKKRKVKKTVKIKEIMKVTELKKIFEKQLTEFKKHVFFMNHQKAQLKLKLDTLQNDELLFRVDCSENYVAKYAKEVQSVHFGASKRQLSLHTGVYYTNVSGKSKPICFATVSDNLDHQAYAVWAHLKPVLEKVAIDFPKTRTIHFYSDGPSNQYKNRINIHLLKTLTPTIFPELETMTWNFTVAGHGKGVMDGVGGSLKREADRKVAHGTDIENAADFIKALCTSKISLTEIKTEEIEKIKSEIPSNIPSIKGIFNVHQICYSFDMMNARTLSCFTCLPGEDCIHFKQFDVFPDFDIIPGLKHPTPLTVDDVYSSSEEDMDHTNSPDEIEEGSWVVAIFDNQWYPGVVERRNEDFLSVNFMSRSGSSRFYWPTKPDVQTVAAEDTLCQIRKPPVPISTRHYAFEKKELEFINKLFSDQ